MAAYDPAIMVASQPAPQQEKGGPRQLQKCSFAAAGIDLDALESLDDSKE